jgi:hypothetical protein
MFDISSPATGEVFDTELRGGSMDVLRYFDETTFRAIHARREYLSAMIRAQCHSIAQYGILKGFQVPSSAWAEVASSAYILGTYEVSVCAILDSLKAHRRTLVDLGGADGIFGVGLVEVGAFGNSLVFELDAERRHAISELVRCRGLSDKVAVFGEATRNLPNLIRQQGISLNDCVVLCDIEGAEFELFDDHLLRQLSESHVIIELHDFLLRDPAARETAVEALKKVAGTYFHVHEIKDGLRDIRNIPQLRDWSDWDSYLLCVEARYRMMSWLWLQPKSELAPSPAALDTMILDYQRRIFAE